MRRHYTPIFLALMILITAACSSRGTNTNNFADNDATGDGDSTNIPPFSTPLPSASPLPTPSPTPGVTNSWQTNPPPSNAYNGNPQTNNWSNFTGWPYNSGYGQGYPGYTGYPSQYQNQYDNYFPTYHSNYNRGYYIAAVTTLYRGILGRDADQPGIQFWMRELIAGRPYTNMREEFLRSPEVTALGEVQHVQNVIGAFRVLLGILPDRNAVQYWAAQLKAGMPLTQLVTQLRQNPQAAVQGFQQGFFTRAVVDLYKMVLGRFANYDELSRDVTGVGTGNPIVESVFARLRASAEANSIGRLTAENCIAVHRIIRGTLPDRGELQRCVAMGDNTASNSGSPYNPVLQRYVQQIMYSYGGGQYPY